MVVSNSVTLLREGIKTDESRSFRAVFVPLPMEIVQTLKSSRPPNQYQSEPIADALSFKIIKVIQFWILCIKAESTLRTGRR